MGTENFDKGKELLKLDLQNKALRKGSDLQCLDISIEWCIDKLIPKQSITLISGKGGIGKTWLSIQLADAISKGLSFMDLETERMPVVYIDFENSLPVLIERIKKVGASEAWFWHTTSEMKPPKLDNDEWYLYKHLPQGSLLIFDTLRASQNRDENDSRHMAFVLSRLKELRDIGFTIILLHHTPKANDRIYKGSTAIFDLSDHVLSLYKVRKGNYEEIDDDDSEDYCYRLGTKDKTRYEPFHIFLDFSPEKGFVIAPDPDTEDLEAIHQLIAEKGRLNQSQIFELVKEELDIKGKKKLTRLLRKGTGGFWTSQKDGKYVYYSPVPLSPTIYKGTDDPDHLTPPYQSPQVETYIQTKQPQHIDNPTLFTSPDKKGQKGTERTDKVIKVLEVSE